MSLTDASLFGQKVHARKRNVVRCITSEDIEKRVVLIVSGVQDSVLFELSDYPCKLTFRWFASVLCFLDDVMWINYCL